MATKCTKDMENKIKTHSEEINYLKSKLYELAKTNKYLENKLDRANQKIQNLEASQGNWVSKHRYHTWKPSNTPTINTHQKIDYHTKENETHEKWIRVENKRSRKNQVNKSRNCKVNRVRKHKNHTLKPPNTLMANTHQRTNYHARKKETNKNETNKNKKPYSTRHTYTQRNTYNESRRYKQLRTKNDH